MAKSEGRLAGRTAGYLVPFRIATGTCCGPSWGAGSWALAVVAHLFKRPFVALRMDSTAVAGRAFALLSDLG
jgi:hypothetical protein